MVIQHAIAVVRRNSLEIDELRLDAEDDRAGTKSFDPKTKFF
jgi:hypothetical protein